MSFENKSAISLTAEAEQASFTDDWNQHEHISDQARFEARKLVRLLGSTKLAKNAIDVVGLSQNPLYGDDRTPTLPTTFQHNDPFFKALENFERSLETPVMSGELTAWVTNVRRECERIDVLLRDEVQRKHSAMYATIAREDPELSSRVEKLREADEQLVRVDFDNVQCSLKQLLDRAESAEQDELKASLLRADVVTQALAFVIGARTQETAIATWFGEAFNRDSGFGD